MNDRERLTELLKPHISGTACLCESGSCELTSCRDCKARRLADHLLVNSVIVPPCKVGQTVYCLIQGFENPLKATVNRITVQVSGVVISCSVLGYFGQSYMATDFGKTVFLTKEEAEEKLKEVNNNA